MPNQHSVAVASFGESHGVCVHDSRWSYAILEARPNPKIVFESTNTTATLQSVAIWLGEPMQEHTQIRCKTDSRNNTTKRWFRNS